MSLTNKQRRSSEAEAYRRWYKTARWRRRREHQLARQPLCERCKARGLIVPATVANHKIPHRGDPDLFWYGELESVCAPCHDTLIQKEEVRGYTIGSDAHGRPVDAGHPWNRRGGGGSKV